jgi:hypothetical protein
MYKEERISPEEPVKRPSSWSLDKYDISDFILAVTSSFFCAFKEMKLAVSNSMESIERILQIFCEDNGKL